MPCYDPRSDPQYQEDERVRLAANNEHAVAAKCLHFILCVSDESIPESLQTAIDHWEEGEGAGFDDQNWVEALCFRLDAMGEAGMRGFVDEYFLNPIAPAVFSWWHRHRQEDADQKKKEPLE